MSDDTVEYKGLHWPKVFPGQAGPDSRQLSAMLARSLGCAGCIFWDRNWWEVGDDWGACKRNPPRIAPPRTPFLKDYDVPHVAGLFPLTTPDEWCGEFSPAPVEPAAKKGPAR